PDPALEPPRRRGHEGVRGDHFRGVPPRGDRRGSAPGRGGGRGVAGAAPVRGRDGRRSSGHRRGRPIRPSLGREDAGAVTAAYFTGLALGLALIVPIGAQNVFVFGQGVALGMPRALWAVIGAGLCDTLLIVLGATGTSALLHSVPGLRPAMLIGGALFLTYLGIRSLRAKPEDIDDE